MIGMWQPRPNTVPPVEKVTPPCQYMGEEQMSTELLKAELSYRITSLHRGKQALPSRFLPTSQTPQSRTRWRPGKRRGTRPMFINVAQTIQVCRAFFCCLKCIHMKSEMN